MRELALCLGIACGGAAGIPSVPEPVEGFAPSLLHAAIDARVLGDVEACGGCHPDHVAAWSHSAHAHASFDNPWYRVAVEALRAEVGREASRHCAGCHDPVLLVAGAMDRPVDPASADARRGVTCLTCHAAVAATSDGNGSLTLVDPGPLPDPGDAAGIARHRDAMRPEALTSGAACGACHRGFLGPEVGNAHHVVGMDDLGPWASSAFAGSHAARVDQVRGAGCVDCHAVDHRFSGAHTPLAAAAGPEELALLASRLQGVATVDIAAVVVDGVRHLLPTDVPLAGREVVLELVIANTGVGHHLPGGTRDLQDTWVELVVADDEGPVAEAGTAHARGDDPTAFLLRAEPLDAGGRPEVLHRTWRMHTLAWDHTVAPRDARVVRYRVQLPEDGEGFTARAVLRHRRFPAAFARAACAEARADDAADACAPQPVTPLAEAEVALAGPEPVPFRRAADLARALAHDLGDHLEDVEAVLAQAERVANSATERAACEVVRAGVHARLGRVEEALAAASRAEALVGPLASAARARVDALAAVWRWPEAAEAGWVAAARAPRATGSWRALAVALAAAGDDAGAQRAARRGLEGAPRDPDLLRVAALAARDEAARAAWLAHRGPDDATDVRLACVREVAGCGQAVRGVVELGMRVLR